MYLQLVSRRNYGRARYTYIVCVLAVILITTLTVGVTYAYLVAQDSKDVTIVTANGVNTTLTLEPIKVSNNLVINYFIIIVISSLVLILYIKENRKKKCASKQGTRKRR